MGASVQTGRETVDHDAPKGNCREKQQRIDDGLDALLILAKPGVGLTQYDIAAWCGCSKQMIDYIEKTALKKLRNTVGFGSEEHRHAGRDLRLHA